MKPKYINTIREFTNGKIEVNIFRGILEDWNRSGFWRELSKKEYKLMGDYFRVYLDFYYGETLPDLSFWEKVSWRLSGKPNVDLTTLKVATIKLLKAIEKLQK